MTSNVPYAMPLRSARIWYANHADDSAQPLCFSLGVLLRDLRRHSELGLHTLAYHLTQSDATAAEGYWHASINEARSFLEALLVSFMATVRRDAPEPSRNGSANGTPFRCYRRSLVEVGFIDTPENVLLQYVYGVASAKGGRAGVTDEAWSRLARRMVFATEQYVFQHYEAWKRAAPPASPPSPNPQPSLSPKSRWRRCLTALTHCFRLPAW